MAIAASMMGLLALVILRFVPSTHLMQKTLTGTESFTQIDKAADQFARDIKQADPVTVDLATQPLASPTVNNFAFQQLIVDVNNPSTPIRIPIRYWTQTDSFTNTVALYRNVNNASTTTLVTANLLAPTAIAPLVQRDVEAVILTLLPATPNQAPVVRRVTIYH